MQSHRVADQLTKMKLRPPYCCCISYYFHFRCLGCQATRTTATDQSEPMFTSLRSDLMHEEMSDLERSQETNDTPRYHTSRGKTKQFSSVQRIPNSIYFSSLSFQLGNVLALESVLPFGPFSLQCDQAKPSAAQKLPEKVTGRNNDIFLPLAS